MIKKQLKSKWHNEKGIKFGEVLLYFTQKALYTKFIPNYIFQFLYVIPQFD